MRKYRVRKCEVSILKDWNGYTFSLVKKVMRRFYRKYIREYDFQRKVHYYNKTVPKYYVIYEGQKYQTFYVQGVGSCIAIK